MVEGRGGTHPRGDRRRTLPFYSCHLLETDPSEIADEIGDAAAAGQRACCVVLKLTRRSQCRVHRLPVATLSGEARVGGPGHELGAGSLCTLWIEFWVVRAGVVRVLDRICEAELPGRTEYEKV